MTPEDREQRIADQFEASYAGNGLLRICVLEAMRQAVAAAVEEERARCAKVADEHDCMNETDGCCGAEIGKKIRLSTERSKA